MEGDTVTMQDIFSFRQNGTDGNGKIAGKFEPTGIHPKILDKIRDNGGYCRDDWFLAERR
ncbi:hypothetical protein [Lacrimispora xylanisolvens]